MRHHNNGFLYEMPARYKMPNGRVVPKGDFGMVVEKQAEGDFIVKIRQPPGSPAMFFAHKVQASDSLEAARLFLDRVQVFHACPDQSDCPTGARECTAERIRSVEVAEGEAAYVCRYCGSFFFFKGDSIDDFLPVI